MTEENLNEKKITEENFKSELSEDNAVTVMKEISDPALSDKDVIYTLRSAQQHQAQLSLLADQKANIIIGFSIIYFSVLQSQIFSAEFGSKIYFTSVLSLSFMVFISFLMAVLVVMPRIKVHRLKSLKDMPNPLFFSSFSLFAEDDYVDHMLSTVKNDLDARKLMIKDIYQIGRVLRKKYFLLKFSYLFMSSGVMISVIILDIKLLFE